MAVSSKLSKGGGASMSIGELVFDGAIEEDRARKTGLLLDCCRCLFPLFSNLPVEEVTFTFRSNMCFTEKLSQEQSISCERSLEFAGWMYQFISDSNVNVPFEKNYLFFSMDGF